MAAHRGGVKFVLIPHENEKDLAEIPSNVKSGLEIKPVRWIDEVFTFALEKLPESIDETTDEANVESANEDGQITQDRLVAH